VKLLFLVRALKSHREISTQANEPKLMPYNPPYTITPKILSLVAQISEAVTSANLLEIQNSPELRKQSRIKTITGTLAIEGNTLSLDQVSAIIEGKPVRGSQREIAEVRGAIKAYESLAQYQAHNMDDLLDAHQKMTEEILPDAGHFRRSGVGIHKGDKVIHVAPQADRVQFLMNDLLNWLKQTDNHPLIRSCVFHYEFEFIHPFSDGNGRMGRLWQTLILGQWRALFYSLPIENTIKNNQQAYYDALESADDKANSTVFIEFMLAIILASINASDPASDPVSDPVEKLLSVMGEGYLSSAQMMAKVGLSHKPTFRKNYLLPALKQGLITMSQPDTPNSPKQKYTKESPQ
jgi:Fic family protein